MARPSKLNPKQWDEIKKRIAAGEKPAALAREFGVSRATISERCQKPAETIRSVANKLVEADKALRSLPVSEQLLTLNLADELKAISFHLAGAARFGAATAHRLTGIANSKVNEIDDAAPLNPESLDALRGVALLTKVANDSATIGLNLLAANKDAVKDMNQQAKPIPQRISVVVEDASVDDAEAQ